MVAKKVFEVLWGLIDDQEPPEAKHRDVQVSKLATALALEGAIFMVARGLAYHGAAALLDPGRWVARRRSAPGELGGPVPTDKQRPENVRGDDG